jgi:hypothetical protein
MIPWFKSVLFHKCPRCLEGDLFPDRNSYNLKQTAVMNPRCLVCDLNFWPEPGYYYGAMYVSYAFTVALAVAVFVAHYVFHQEINVMWYLIELTLTLALAAPYTFRTSRAIWLNFFNKYNPKIRAETLAHKGH